MTSIVVALLVSLPISRHAAADSASGPPRDEDIRVLYYTDGSVKTVTSDDLVWLGRMIEGETWNRPSEADAAAMIWTIVQRSLWAPAYANLSLGELARNYSQPISAAWRRKGVRCRGRESDSGECSTARLDQRERAARRDWSEFSETTKTALLRFANGKLDNPVPGAIGWYEDRMFRSIMAKPARRRNQEMRSAVSVSEIEGNVFYASNGLGQASRGYTKDSTDWGRYEVGVRCLHEIALVSAMMVSAQLLAIEMMGMAGVN